MNDIQYKATAAGFLHALKESPELRSRWADAASSDDFEGNLCSLIGETLGSAQKPTSDDLANMRKYCNSQLGSHLDELHQLDKTIEPGLCFNGRRGGGG